MRHTLSFSLKSVVIAMTVTVPASSAMALNAKAETDFVSLTTQSDYFVRGLTVRDFFNELSTMWNVRIVVDESVGGQIRNLRYTGNPETILNRLSSTHALDWFYYSGVIYVSARDASITRLLSIAETDRKKLSGLIQDDGLNISRFGMNLGSSSEKLTLTAPAKYIALVENAIEKSVRVEAPKKPILVRRANSIESE